LPHILLTGLLTTAVNDGQAVTEGIIAQVIITQTRQEIIPGVFAGTKVTENLPCVGYQQERANVVVVVGFVVMTTLGSHTPIFPGRNVPLGGGEITVSRLGGPNGGFLRIYPQEISQICAETMAVIGKCCIFPGQYGRAIEPMEMMGQAGKKLAVALTIRETDGFIRTQEGIFLEKCGLLTRHRSGAGYANQLYLRLPESCTSEVRKTKPQSTGKPAPNKYKNNIMNYEYKGDSL
jgi:hypothetical protein